MVKTKEKIEFSSEGVSSDEKPPKEAVEKAAAEGEHNDEKKLKLTPGQAQGERLYNVVKESLAQQQAQGAALLAELKTTNFIFARAFNVDVPKL